MVDSQDPRLSRASIRARYNGGYGRDNIDPWHEHTAREIRKEIAPLLAWLNQGSGRVILNAGAGDDALGLSPSNTVVNLDLSEDRLRGMSCATAGNVEQLPFSNESIDCVVCIGSVLNYCDAAAAVSEFSRVLRPSGYAVIEFESSLSAELLSQSSFAQSAAPARTFFAGEEEVLWAYRPGHIRRITSAANLELVRSVCVHVATPWLLLVSRSAKVAAKLAWTDRILRHIPGVRALSSNHVLTLRKERLTSC